MSSNTTIYVPDLGGADQVEVIEILVTVGDQVAPEHGLINVEGDKASMDIPSSSAGTVAAILVNVGDKVSEGTAIVELATGETQVQATETSALALESSAVQEVTAPEVAVALRSLLVPDLGGADEVEVIEVHIAPGDFIEKEIAVVTLESDKASMDVPAEFSGKVVSLAVKVGDKVSEGMKLAEVEETSLAVPSPASPAAPPQSAASTPQASSPQNQSSQVGRSAPAQQLAVPVQSYEEVHASPSVRRFGRELGVDLTQIAGTGEKARIVKENVQDYVRKTLNQPGRAGRGAVSVPDPVNFAQFGEVEHVPFNKIKKLTGQHMEYCWSTVPHVTQFGEVDITATEAFRQDHKDEAMQKGVRLTLLAFVMQVLAQTLQEFPHFNASLDPNGEGLLVKKYCNLGMAVETPAGLVVPVIKDVIGKSLLEIAYEMGMISKKAREAGLTPADMKGGCMTISSLGGIGGTAFTPIVNAPEVAILGVSKSYHKPVLVGDEFVPRLMLPLSLSYDHRVIDGAEGARFLTRFAELLSDIRNLLL